MFKKLLSNLPFNPSLIGQLSFYAKRMHNESRVRRLGFIFLAFAMFVQLFAVISPPQSSLSASPDNDLIVGGFASQDEVVDHCKNPIPNENYDLIAIHFGITCDNIANATYVPSLGANERGGNLLSMGRQPKNKPGEVPIDNINGVGTLWVRYLWGWDNPGAESHYRALYGTTDAGLEFYILFDCGNFVFVNYPPTPSPPPPQAAPPVVVPQELSCSNLFMNVGEGTKVELGTQLLVRGQASGKNIVPGQLVDMHYDYVDAKTNKVVSQALAQGLPFNGSTADDTQARTFTAEKPGDYLIRLTVTHGDNQVAPGSATGNCLKHINVEKPCEEFQSKENLKVCLDTHKKAKNTTQNLEDAQTKIAQPGDTIVYTLTTSNSGNITVPKVVVRENMSDVLDYVDMKDVDLHGGTMDDNKDVVWPAVDIKAGETVTNEITVKIMSSVPSTPVSSSDPGHFDCKIANFYGTGVTISIKCSVAKTVETTTKLPNTGPGESLAIGFGVMTVVGYFFARSRLFATELDIVREDFANSGGV